MPRQLTIPMTLAELIQDPQRVRDAFALLNMLAGAQVRIVGSGKTDMPLSVSGNTLIIPIPVKLDAPIADAETTPNQSELLAKFNLLLAALRRTGQLPS